MIDTNSPTSSVYDTSINVIGGIQDWHTIFRAIETYFLAGNSPSDLTRENKEVALRTERSRIRVNNAIKASFLVFKNNDHRVLVQDIFTRRDILAKKELILFWQYALSNTLFRDISTQVFCKAYFSGRASLSKEDIVAYLKEFISTNKNLDLDWSESTVNTLSTKYLNLMTKLNLLDGSRIKSFKYVQPSSEEIVLFVYFSKLLEPEKKNILEYEMIPLLFLSNDDIQERLKKLSLRGYFNMTFNGVDLNIELTHSYKEICDVLYHR